MAGNDRRRVRIASGTNLMLGLVLATSPWLLRYASVDPDMAFCCAWIGSLVALGAAARLCWPQNTSALSGANAVFGAWTAIAPHVYGASPDLSVLWFHLVLGGAIAACGAWSIRATLAGERGFS